MGGNQFPASATHTDLQVSNTIIQVMVHLALPFQGENGVSFSMQVRGRRLGGLDFTCTMYALIIAYVLTCRITIHVHVCTPTHT